METKELLVKNGYVNAGLSDVMRLWSEYSDSHAAGWLGLPEESEEAADDMIFDCVKPYIKTVFYHE